MKDDGDELKKLKNKKPGYMKWYPEKWLAGSLREEFTSAERGVWGDFLCLGFENDPPGQIDFTSFRRLANRLSVSKKLLSMTVRRAIQNAKVRIIKIHVDPENGKKFEDFEITLDQLCTIGGTFDAKGSKHGVPLYAIIFLRWDEHQPAWLRQRPYQKKGNQDAENPAELAPDIETNIHIKGKDKDNIRKDNDKDKEPDPQSLDTLNPSSGSPFPCPSHKTITPQEYLVLLKAIPNYPYDANKDLQIYYLAAASYPKINLRRQVERKLLYWKENPGTMQHNPREQLLNFFRSHEFARLENE